MKTLLKRCPSVVRCVQTVRAWKAVLVWRWRGAPYPPPPEYKQLVVRRYARRFRIEVLVETGTFLGDMVWFNRFAFQAIHSIELDETLHEKSRLRCVGISHVNLIKGDSGALLPAILSKIHRPALFWLDAHYSGGVTARGRTDTPIMEELRAILERNEKGDVILIDDARSFVGCGGYPRITDVFQLVRARCPEVKVEVVHDIIRINP